MTADGRLAEALHLSQGPLKPDHDTCLCREDAIRIADTEPGASLLASAELGDFLLEYANGYSREGMSDAASLLADAAVGRAFNAVGIRFSVADLRTALAELGSAGNLAEGIVMVAARAAAEALDAAALGDDDDA